jgi:hypothetical protein
MSGAMVAISLEQDRLLAVAGSDSGGRFRVRTWVSAQAPTGLELRDATKVGEWIKAEFEKAGLSGSKLTIAVPRGDVVLKKLKLPRTEGSGELAGMVRLQMARQLTMAIEGTAIDYVPIENGGGAEAGGASDAGSSTPRAVIDVLAGALPADRMQWYRELAEGAGCTIGRVGLRASGAAALLAGASHRHNGPVLGVALGWNSIEFIVVRDGQLVFARAADVGLSGSGAEGLGARVAVEAKRTWMSYRVGDEAAAVEAVVVPGSGALAREAGEACGKALEMPWELAEIPGAVEMPREMSEADRLAAGPLIGLLAEELLATRSLDFANPRKAPDLAGVVGAARGRCGVGGGGYVYSGMQVASAEQRLKDAKERSAGLRADYNAYLMDHAKLSHIQKWREAGFDWLAHANWLSEQMPDPRQAQLDQFGGAAGISVDLIPNGGRYDVNGWRVRQVAKFSMQGKARQREVANELRDRLVSSPVYQVETKGADQADRFSMELTTEAAAPEDAKTGPAAPKPATKGSGGPAAKPATPKNERGGGK